MVKTAGFIIFRNKRINKEKLVPFIGSIRFRNTALALAQGFDLTPIKNNASFNIFFDKVVKARSFIQSNNFSFGGHCSLTEAKSSQRPRLFRAASIASQVDAFKGAKGKRFSKETPWTRL